MVWNEQLTHSATDASIGHSVAEAICDLLKHDRDLLKLDVHERTITGKLADHLRTRFLGWDVDVEYNRDGHQVKRANDDIVVPDVIVHRRNTPDNLLVVEVKKSTSAVSDNDDLDKLACFKSSPNLAYRHALFIKFTVGIAPDVERVEWV